MSIQLKLAVISTLILSLASIGCDSNEDNIPVKGISFNKSETSILLGSVEQLVATITPADATNPEVLWSSNDESVLSVSDSGLATATGVGIANVTVITEDGSYIASLKVTTSPIPIAVTSVSLEKSSSSILIGDNKQLKAEIIPANATNQNLNWSSNNENVTVSTSGFVTGNNIGSATITVSTQDGGFTDNCDIEIKTRAVTGISLNKAVAIVDIGTTRQLNATITPVDATNQKMVWSSSDESVATISTDGLITGVKTGTAIITVTTEDGLYSQKCKVLVHLFVSRWKTNNEGTSTDNQIKLPLDPEGTYDFTVDWGDGIRHRITTHDQAEVIHTYSIAGTYDIVINGTIEGFGFSGYHEDNNKLIDILSWGIVKLHNEGYQLCYTRLFSLAADDTPDLSNVTNMSHMFDAAFYFNGKIGDWDVSSITDMSHMFDHAWEFNQDIGDWNVSNVTNMSHMFDSAKSFNQDIGGWNVIRAIKMAAMFCSAETFNQDIGGWKVSNVTNMRGMFLNAKFFNQDLGNWDVSNVTAMDTMFYGAYFFNRDIGGWDVSGVTEMGNMFSGAKNFNQDIGDWQVSNVTDMASMFEDAYDFNQDISGWDVTNVNSYSNIFKNCPIEESYRPSF